MGLIQNFKAATEKNKMLKAFKVLEARTIPVTQNLLEESIFLNNFILGGGGWGVREGSKSEYLLRGEHLQLLTSEFSTNY